MQRDPSIAPGSAIDNEERTAAGLVVWRQPTITIIDIKRTMFFGGSFIDGVVGTASS